MYHHYDEQHQRQQMCIEVFRRIFRQDRKKYYWKKYEYDKDLEVENKWLFIALFVRNIFFPQLDAHSGVTVTELSACVYEYVRAP